MSDAPPREVRLSVPSVDCASCAAALEDGLADVDGVLGVEALPAAGAVVVRYDPEATPEAAVVSAVEAAGYPVDADGDAPSPHAFWRSRRALSVWVGAGLLVAGLALEFGHAAGTRPLAAPLGYALAPAGLAFLGATAAAGGPVLRAAYGSLRARDVDVEALMGAGIVGAVVVGLPFEAATLAVLYSLAELLERFSMDRTRSSLRDLLELAPAVATVLEDGEERTVPAETVAVGDTVVVRPGERLPVDGEVVAGRSAVDESPVTGESVPRGKGPGDEVYAGSINLEGYLEVEATTTAGDSTLARVVDLVADAERARTSHERFVDRFASYYTPVIVAGAVLTVPASMLAFGLAFDAAFVRGLTLLVVACPCALVISTPVSVVSGVTAAARNGVLVKGGDTLEAAGEVGLVAFDKTGTLTSGELRVTDVEPVAAADGASLLSVAAAVERRSEHPIARALVDAAEARGVEVPDVEAFEALPGRGVRATVDGVVHYAGKPGLVGAVGEASGGRAADGGSVAESGAVAAAVEALEADGRTAVVVGTASSVLGVIGVADTVRPEAAAAVSRLHDLGVETAMLTGDNERTARAIAAEVGIDRVRAGLLPEEKVAAVRELSAAVEGGVAMVGDGVNDAPALAAADVGVAMGAAGTDAAIETADVALLGDDLGRVPYLCRLARRANRVIRENVWSSLAVKAVLAIGAPLGLVSVIVAIVVGDMGMSLAVTGNAMRLAGVAPER